MADAVFSMEAQRRGHIAMKAITLLYHDVIEAGRAAESGFSSADADLYKLRTADFERHLDAIGKTGRTARLTVAELLAHPERQQEVPIFLSFDDGGASALATADLLDGRGWKGHFFITTDFIDSAAFVTSHGIRDLHARGHIVGSHSCSHPARISYLTDAELGREWRQSVQKLEEILGAKIETASVPGGFYTRRVAEFASRAGIRALFNSEPVTGVSQVESCLLIGRFGLQRDSPPELAARFAKGDGLTLWREAAFWNAKKLVKAVGGERWLAFRKWWLAR